MIDRKMADLRTTTNSLFLGISSQRFKLVGDICLLVVAVLWLGTSVWDEFKAEDEAEGGARLRRDAVAVGGRAAVSRRHLEREGLVRQRGVGQVRVGEAEGLQLAELG